jgi:hypothetical protein
MKPPAFNVTAGVVTALVFIGVMKVILVPYLPASSVDKMLTLDPSQKLAAPMIDIGWKSSIPEALAAAKAKRTGVLWLFVDPTSTGARDVETKFFRRPELARFVKRFLIPLRINLGEQPEWNEFLFPISRTKTYIEPGIGLMVTDENGNVAKSFFYTNADNYRGFEPIYAAIIESKTILLEMSKNPSYVSETMRSQKRELDDLSLPSGGAIPYFDAEAQNLVSKIDPKTGGFVNFGYIGNYPAALRFLFNHQSEEVAEKSMNRLLTSRLYDVIDGGFFHRIILPTGAKSDEGGMVETSKSATENALAAEVLAEMGLTRNNKAFQEFSLDTMRMILRDLCRDDIPTAGFASDLNPDARSRRFSLTQNRRSDLLNSRQKNWADENLFHNIDGRQELASFANPDAILSPEFQPIRTLIRSKLSPLSTVMPNDRIEIMAYVAARLMRGSMLLSDQEILRRTSEIADQCYRSVANGDVNRYYAQSEAGEGWLGSYLSVADLALTDYSVNGRIESLNLGRSIILKALTKFRDGKNEYLLQTPPSQSLVGALTSVPQLTDFNGESLTSKAIRLAYSYALITNDSATVTQLISFATGSTAFFASRYTTALPHASAFLNTAERVVLNRTILVFGGDCVNQSLQISRMIPRAAVFPIPLAIASQSDRKRLGIYILNGENLEGPFPLSEVGTHYNAPFGS